MRCCISSGRVDSDTRFAYNRIPDMVEERVMTNGRWLPAMGLILLGLWLPAFVVNADELAGGNTALTQPGTGTLAPSTLTPGSGAPLVGLQQSGALSLVPPGTGTATRNDGLAGSGATGVDLSYVPPAERDSYLNSHDFADHLQTSTRWGHHPSALSQLGGVAEGMAINGLLGEGTSLVLGGH